MFIYNYLNINWIHKDFLDVTINFFSVKQRKSLENGVLSSSNNQFSSSPDTKCPTIQFNFDIKHLKLVSYSTGSRAQFKKIAFSVDTCCKYTGVFMSSFVTHSISLILFHLGKAFQKIEFLVTKNSHVYDQHFLLNYLSISVFNTKKILW